jgi:hypothetical protein
MLQNILKLEGAKKLTADQQKTIKGGAAAAVCYPKCLWPKICIAGNKCLSPE